MTCPFVCASMLRTQSAFCCLVSNAYPFTHPLLSYNSLCSCFAYTVNHSPSSTECLTFYLLSCIRSAFPYNVVIHMDKSAALSCIILMYAASLALYSSISSCVALTLFLECV